MLLSFFPSPFPLPSFLPPPPPLPAFPFSPFPPPSLLLLFPFCPSFPTLLPLSLLPSSLSPFPFLPHSLLMQILFFYPQDQFDAHVYDGLLNVYTYYGSDRTKDKNVLAEQDVVLTTYQTLSSEFSKVYHHFISLTYDKNQKCQSHKNRHH